MNGERIVEPENFVQTLHMNVDNKKLTDAEFRKFVRATLPIVKYGSPKGEEWDL